MNHRESKSMDFKTIHDIIIQISGCLPCLYWLYVVRMHVLSQLSSINKICLILVKVVPFQNMELDFQLNMNVDQSTHVILIIRTWKNDFFWTKPLKSPLYIFVLISP